MYEQLDQELLDIASIYPVFECGEDERIRVGSLLCNKIGEHLQYKKEDSEKLNSIKETGYTHLNPNFNHQEIESIKDFLSDKLVYGSHIPPSDGILRTVEESRKINASACYQAQDLLQCPHILGKILSEDTISLVENYLGCVPTLYSFNVYWTFTEHPGNVGVKLLHRDVDDYKFCCMMTYLTDVDDNTGPFSYVKYTHTDKACNQRHKNESLSKSIALREGHGFYEAFRELDEDMDTMIGPQGTSFLADTFGIHKAGSNLTKDRLIMWVRFGTHNNPGCRIQTPNPASKNLIQDKNIVFDDKLKYITRRIINHEV